jgi:hypothetical protein
MTPEEKQRAIREMNREHLALARRGQRQALDGIERFKEQGKWGRRAQRDLDALARDMRRRGETVPAQLARLVTDE